MNKSSGSFLSAGNQKAINGPALLYLTDGETEGPGSYLAFLEHPRPQSNLSILSDILKKATSHLQNR